MVNITLRGILGKKFGEKWNLHVSSVLEIFEAIEANTSKVSYYFRNVTKFSTHFFVIVDGKMIPSYLLNSKMLKSGSKVEIVPVVQGGVAAVLFVIGVILTVLSIIITKMLSPKSPRDVKTSSTVLGQIRNVTKQNIVVPIGYGRLRVGSAVISNSLSLYSAEYSEASGPNRDVYSNLQIPYKQLT
jgi:predicted phage tail protein